jgi:hypothetical protein
LLYVYVILTLCDCIKRYKNDRNNIETFHVFYTQTMSPSTSAATKTTIVIVSKSGTLSECIVDPKNETTLEDLTLLLSKKCGFRATEGFSCYHTWRYRNKHKYSFNTSACVGGDNEVGHATVPKYIYIDLWGKTDGRAGQENKYELPPPVDHLLMYGSIALVARIDKQNAVNLTIKLWEVIYEKLFGGFEDLSATVAEDENEIDELESIPQHKKTSNGYLKDGFVIEDDSEDTPRCKRVTRGRGGGKKPKSESTESEFVTETETESGTPTSESPNASDKDCEDEDEIAAGVVHEKIPLPVNKIVSKKCAIKPKRVIKKQGVGKTKKVQDEQVVDQEIESELSEESYD